MNVYKALTKNTVRRQRAAVVSVLILITSLGSMIGAALAVAPPNIISYQGRILDDAGVPVADATADINFEIYDGDDPGTDTCLWSNDSSTCNGGTGSSTAVTATLTDGLFSENLGDTSASFAAISDSVFADNTTLYLAVSINGEALTPLKRITSQGSAINSSLLDGLNSSAIGGTSAFVPVTGSNGNLVLTGDPQGIGVSQGSLYINPTAAGAGETLFGLAVGGVQTFKIDADGNSDQIGDITADGILTINGAGESLFIDAINIQGNATLGNAATDTLTLSGTITGASPFTLEGATANDFETTLTIIDPTADNVIFVPNAAGTLALTSNITLQNAYDTGNSILATDASDLEITLPNTATDPNAIFNLAGAGDFVIQDNGVAFATFNDSGNVIFANSVDLGSSDTDNIAVNGIFTTDLIPDGDPGTSLGSDGGRWGDLYLSESTLHIGVDIADEGTIGYDPSTNQLDIGSTSGNIALGGSLLILSTGQLTTNGDLAVNGDDITSDGTLTINSSGIVQLGTDDDLLPQLGAGSADLGALATRWDNLYAAAADITGTLSAGTLSCTDCLNFTSFSDSLSLDATTSIDVGANNLQFSGSSTGDFVFGADGDTNVRITASAAPAVSMLALSNASFPSATNNAHGISLSYFATNVSANPIQIAADYSGNGGDVFSIFSAGNMNASSTGTDTVNGLSIGNLTETGDITSAAFNIGTGWDKILDSTLDIAGSSGDLSDDSGAVTINDDLTITTGTTLSAASITTLNCTDCISFDDLSDTPSLDAALAISQGAFAWSQDYTGDTGNGVSLTAGSLTTGAGLSVQRANAGGSDYNGSASTALAYIDQQDIGGGTGNALQVVQKTSGTGSGVYIVQNTVGAPTADAISNQALVIDVNEATSADSVLRIRSNVTAAADTIFDINNLGAITMEGGITAGDANGTSSFSFTSSTTTDAMALAFDTVTTGDGIDLSVDGLTTGSGLKVSLADGSDYTAGSADALVYIEQANNNPGTTGDALKISNIGGGTSTAVMIYQKTTDNVAASQNGLVLDAGEMGSTDKAIVLRANVDTAAATEFFVQTNGVVVGGLDGIATTNGLCHSGADVDASTDVVREFVACSAAPDDYAEWYETDGSVDAGDIVAITDQTITFTASQSNPLTGQISGTIQKTLPVLTKGQYSDGNKVFGVVSTSPVQVIGSDLKRQGAHPEPIALNGRIPLNATAENGAIAPGDPLTASNTPGFAMKANSGDLVIATALGGLANGTGKIQAFVRYSAGTINTASAADNSASQVGTGSSLASLDMTGNLFMGGQQILSIGRLAGISDNWSVEEDGTFVTTKTYTAEVATTQGDTATVTSVMSPEVTLTLSGTSELDHGQATIDFEQIDPAFNDIISTVAPIRVIVTANGPTGPLYVSDKDHNGFTVEESSGSSNGISFDWLVIAYRNGYEPVEELEAPEAVTEVVPEEVVENTPEGESETIEADSVAEETPAETPTESETTQPEAEPVAEEPPVETVEPIDDPVIAQEPIATEEPTTL